MGFIYLLSVQCARVPASPQQTAVPDPQPRGRAAGAEHFLCGGEPVPQGGGLSC